MRRRKALTALLGTALVAVCLAGGVAGRSFWTEYQSFQPPRKTVETLTARQVLREVREITLPSDDGVLRGWFVPGTERGAVLLLHGFGGSRQELLPEMRILSERGLSVLAIDWPGHGQSDGKMYWDEPERKAVRSALDFLSKQKEVDANRIGAFGFSLGGYVLLQVATTDTRVRAVAVAGTPAHVSDLTRWEHRSHGAIGGWAAILATHAVGMHPDELVPEQLVAQLAPRPLLVVEGAEDMEVPPELVRRVYDAAREPKEWLLLPHAHHGDYVTAHPDLYTRKLGTFFSNALLGEGTAQSHSTQGHSMEGHSTPSGAAQAGAAQAGAAQAGAAQAGAAQAGGTRSAHAALAPVSPVKIEPTPLEPSAMPHGVTHVEIP